MYISFHDSGAVILALPCSDELEAACSNLAEVLQLHGLDTVPEL